MTHRLFTCLKYFALSATMLATTAFGVQPLTISADPDAIMRLGPVADFYADPIAIHDPAKVIASIDNMIPSEISPFITLATKEGTFYYHFALKNPFSDRLQVVIDNESPTPIKMSHLIFKYAMSISPMLDAGSEYTERQQPFSSRIAYSLNLEPGTTDFYLAVDCHGQPCTPVFAVRHANNFKNFDRLGFLIMLACTAATVSFFIYFGLTTIFSRSKVYFWGLIIGLSYTLVILCLTGFPVYFKLIAGRFVLSNWTIWLCISGFSMHRFALALLDVNRGNNPMFWRVSLIVSYSFPLLMPFSFVFAQQVSPAIIAIAVASVGFLTYMSTYRWLKQGQKYGIYYGVQFLIMIAAMALNILSVSGVIYQSVLMSQILSISACVQIFVAMMGMNARSMADRKQHDALKFSLKGAIADLEIDKIVAMGVRIHDEPVHRYVTVMAIDIVGHSMIYQRLGTAAAYDVIKRLFSDITHIIHEHQGVIDRSLGDGILCFFGYNFTNTDAQDHPSQAYLCAEALQTYTAAQAIKREDLPDQSVFPLRIGINSSVVCIGNMGDQTRYELTLAGDGVVLANKFEACCEPFKVILSKSTFERLTDSERLMPGFNPIRIPIKQDHSPVEAFEFNPFESRPDLLARAKAQYWHVTLVKKKDLRYEVRKPLIITSSVGSMQILNYSLGGFCLMSTVFFAKGTLFDLDLEIVRGSPLFDFVSPLAVEVMWSISQGDGSFRHGVQIIGGNTAKRSIILEILNQKLMLDPKESA